MKKIKLLLIITSLTLSYQAFSQSHVKVNSTLDGGMTYYVMGSHEGNSKDGEEAKEMGLSEINTACGFKVSTKDLKDKIEHIAERGVVSLSYKEKGYRELVCGMLKLDLKELKKKHPVKK